MSTVPASAKNLADIGTTGLQMKAWSKKLQRESVLDDVFNRLKAGIDTSQGKAVMPNAIFMELDEVPEGTHETTVPFMKAFNEDARWGNKQNMLGYEEDIDLRQMTVYYNEVKKSVASLGWGIDFQDINYLGVYKEITPAMGEWFKEIRGRRIREASLLRYATELTKDPISKDQNFMPNIFVPNTDLGDMPAYDYDGTVPSGGSGTYPDSDQISGDFVEEIGDTLLAATAEFAKPEYCNLDVSVLQALSFHVEHNLKIKPIVIDGEPVYIFLVPANQLVTLMDETATKSMGAIWRDVTANPNIQKIPGFIKQYKNLVLISDLRYPTLTLSGDNGSWILTPGFKQPGDQDGRNHGAFSNTSGALNRVFDAGFVYGAGALCEWVVQAAKYATESTEYGKFNGKGAYELSGIQGVVFDLDTPTDSSFANVNMCTALMAKPQIVTVSET